MGNIFANMAGKKFVDIDNFKFLDSFEVATTNGLQFNNFYLPEEIVLIIFSKLRPEELLRLSLVCRKWSNLIKSHALWYMLYEQEYSRRAKKLPWYVYYSLLAKKDLNSNFIKNGNGQKVAGKEFEHWQIIKNYGDSFQIEDPPSGADPLPSGVPDFNGKTSCFATSYYECDKLQVIGFDYNPLLRYIIKQFKPHIYVSEWVAGRFDCGSVYNLTIRLCSHFYEKVSESEEEDNIAFTTLLTKQEQFQVAQWVGGAWKKVEILLDDYPVQVCKIIFQHEGHDTQFWKGHYGIKMAGGVVKFLFDSIKEED